ncbi:hypothetical protein ACFQIB_01700 [Jeongeupia naejangsanensis]|uniref:Uncharacterized protein n=1 Tax=Jeongeupia naejangsanensis TaxID=613195 RepID=A0ABS2BF72_9NEIS|nr:hypothetical protein [Jeongeupia naejangsanensis]MBM3114257.1 hypothetical protein [Jeongeupia naejangsanensis]
MNAHAEAARLANTPWRANALLSASPARLHTHDLAIIRARGSELEVLRNRRRDHQVARELKTATCEVWQWRPALSSRNDV